jgi:hypothetical protein
MGNGYDAKLDVIVGEAAKLKRTSNEREYFVVALRKYDKQETKVDFARYFDASTGRQLRQPKLGRLTADEAVRIGEALTTAGKLAGGKAKAKAKGKKTRTAKAKSDSPLQQDIQAAEEANLLNSQS